MGDKLTYNDNSNHVQTKRPNLAILFLVEIVDDKANEGGHCYVTQAASE